MELATLEHRCSELIQTAKDRAAAMTTLRVS